jgi:PleD family two-component response regulator
MRGKVLIVDDYSDWRNMLSGLIEREGHLVESVSTREAALAYIDENKDLDLVILDIRLVETEENNMEPWRLSARPLKSFRPLIFFVKPNLILMISDDHFRTQSNKRSGIAKPGKIKNLFAIKNMKCGSETKPIRFGDHI